MRAEEAVARLGGVATRSAIRELVSERALARSLEAGRVVRDGLGRYSLAVFDAHLHAANALAGTASHLTAALHWGWEVKTPPRLPHVTVPRKRRVAAERRLGVVVHWADLGPEDRTEFGVTSPARTLVDCLTTCPFDEGLAVADSALRRGAVSREVLVELAACTGGRGSGTARRVAAHADARSANPFESVLRAIALEVPSLHLVPQVQIDEFRPDLVDVDHRIVLEADSHTWHSSRKMLLRDCRRYNALVLRGWTVLRFAWEDVMFDPVRVKSDLERVARQALPRIARSKRAK